MVTPPESPEHIWDPLPLPEGYLPDPVDLDVDDQPEIEDEMIDEGEDYLRDMTFYIKHGHKF